MDRTENIYQGTDDAGRMCFRQNTRITTDLQGSWTPGIALVAMGLTEACCRIGTGKVYYVPTAKRYSKDPGTSGSKTHDPTQRVWGFYRMPKLLYIPYHWSKEDKDSWLGMSHYMGNSQEQWFINANVNDTSGPKVLLAIVPKTFLGWHTQMRQTASAAGKFQGGGLAMDDPRGSWHITDDTAMAEHRCENAEAVIEELCRMYNARMPGSHIQYRSLIDALIKLDGLKG
ncbi:MAG: hypothetical protein Q9174_003312 [Haloplaca sp. 1 TL-2023]